VRVDSEVGPRARDRVGDDWRRLDGRRRGAGWTQSKPVEKHCSAAELTQLLALVSRGDQAAFASFFDATSPAVYGMAIGAVGDNPCAEAVTREVFVSAWALAGTFDAARSTPFGWLCGIAQAQIRLTTQATATG